MDRAMDIIGECCALNILAEDCSAILHAAGYKGYTWEKVADIYEAIYCQEEGK